MHIRHLYFVLILSVITFLARAQAPTATIVMPTGTLCTGVPITFSSVVSGSVTAYSWSLSPASGFVMANGATDAVTITFTNALTYSLTLFVANSSGTFATGGFVTVARSAKASYRAYLSDAGIPTNLVLENYSKNYNAINWNFAGAAPTQSTESLVQPFTSPGNYTVSLVAYGASGCNDTLDYVFTVDGESDIKLVNVFTPNGDGNNDAFKPIIKGIYELKVWVYDRWGVLMHNWNGTGGSWDGYTTSGIKCEAGVYFYVLEARGYDQKEFKLKSNLTLIR